MSSHHCFFFNDTATTEIYTLSLHDALPISLVAATALACLITFSSGGLVPTRHANPFLSTDRKSTRLNSSHSQISYAVFCLKKKITPSTYAYIHHLLRQLYVYQLCVSIVTCY